METENEERKVSESPQPAQEAAPSNIPTAAERSNRSFAERMGGGRIHCRQALRCCQKRIPCLQNGGT